MQWQIMITSASNEETIFRPQTNLSFALTLSGINQGKKNQTSDVTPNCNNDHKSPEAHRPLFGVWWLT